MDHFEEIESVKEKLIMRSELLALALGKIGEIAESEGKNAVAQYLFDRFGIRPSAQNTDLLFKDWLFEFNEQGDFVGASSGANAKSTVMAKSSIGKNVKR